MFPSHDQQAGREEKQEKRNLQFDDVDKAITKEGVEERITAPKTIERLEEISEIRNSQRKTEEDDEEDMGSSDNLNISNVNIDLDVLDVHNIDAPTDDTKSEPDILLDDIEILS